jgi:hypothetical protein
MEGATFYVTGKEHSRDSRNRLRVGADTLASRQCAVWEPLNEADVAAA